MKKRADDQDKKFPPCTLFLDDIEEIIQQIKSVTSDIGISDKSYEFDSIEELIQNSGSKIKELKLRGRYGISVNIAKHSIYLFVSGYDEKYIGVFYILREFLKSKVGWLRRFLRPMRWLFIVWFSLIGVPIISTIIKHKPELKVIDQIYTIIFGLMLLFYVISLLLTWKGSTIYLERRHKVSKFWERNRDTIIVGIITAIIGGIVVGIITYFLK